MAPGCWTPCPCCPRWPTSWWCAACATHTWRGPTGPAVGRCTAASPPAVYGGLGAGLRATSRGLDKLAATGAGPRLEAGPPRPLRQRRGQRTDRRPPAAGATAARHRDGGPARGPRRGARPGRPGGRVPRSDRAAGGVPARPLRERVLLEPASRPHRDDVRRDAGRARLDPGLPARQHRPRPARERRGAGLADAAGGRRVAGAGHPDRAGRSLARRPGDAGRRRRRGRAARVRQGLERRWSPTWSPSAPRTSGPRSRGGSGTAVGVSAGCRRRRRSAGSSTGARSGSTTWSPGSPRTLPPLPHARYRLVAATLTASQRHPVGHVVGDLLVRPRSAYGRDRRGSGAVPRRRGAARRPHRPLRAAQPPRRAPRHGTMARMTVPAQPPTASCAPRPPSTPRPTRSGTC